MTQALSQGLRHALVDASAYYALAAPGDAWHRLAVVIATRLADQNWRLFTTNYILAETHALLLARLGRARALVFVQDMDKSSTQIIRATTGDERRAREIIERYTDKDFSLVDAISFSVMERLNIRYAFAFDQHFAQYGFTVLTPELV